MKTKDVLVPTKYIHIRPNMYHIYLRPGIWGKYFLSFPQKNLSQEKTETNKVFYFQFLNDKIYSYITKSHLALWQFGKIGVLVHFVIQKLKSKHLVCLSFLWWQGFLREREKIFSTYSGPEQYLAYIAWSQQNENIYPQTDCLDCSPQGEYNTGVVLKFE